MKVNPDQKGTLTDLRRAIQRLAKKYGFEKPYPSLRKVSRLRGTIKNEKQNNS
jgi:hypothetical protein